MVSFTASLKEFTFDRRSALIVSSQWSDVSPGASLPPVKKPNPERIGCAGAERRAGGRGVPA